jgi:hypothetical protein
MNVYGNGKADGAAKYAADWELTIKPLLSISF